MTKISALPLADDIDPASDMLPILDASTNRTERIPRNTLLGLSSAPVGLDDSQTLTNKTLTAPTISAPTLSGTLTGTYTIGGTPTFPSSVATLTGTQTLTNKTLTAPTINAPTITNPTITTDSISEHTAANGVTIDGVNMKDGAVTNGVVPNSLQSNTGTSWTWQDWTPTWTNFSIGNGTITAKYVQIGMTVHFALEVVLGSTSSFSGNILVSFPVTANSYLTGSSPVALGRMVDVSGGVSVMATLEWESTTTMQPVSLLASSTYVGVQSVSATAPFTWATGDTMSFSGTYEAA